MLWSKTKIIHIDSLAILILGNSHVCIFAANNFGSYGNISLALEGAGDTKWWTASEILNYGETQEDLQPFLTIYTFNERVDSKLFAPFSSYGWVGAKVNNRFCDGRLLPS